jgi:hypothetical protein
MLPLCGTGMRRLEFRNASDIIHYFGFTSVLHPISAANMAMSTTHDPLRVPTAPIVGTRDISYPAVDTHSWTRPDDHASSSSSSPSRSSSSSTLPARPLARDDTNLRADRVCEVQAVQAVGPGGVGQDVRDGAGGVGGTMGEDDKGGALFPGRVGSTLGVSLLIWIHPVLGWRVYETRL